MAIKTKLKKSEFRSYLNKDFESFRADLVSYARTFFSDKMQDFGDATLGGLLLDMNAYVGDVMSYYLDHQFNELDIETAVEDRNVQRLLRNAGVRIMGATPAVADVDFFMKINSNPDDTSLPIHDHLPKIEEGTVVSSTNGVDFTLVDDIDFAEKDAEGNYLFQQITPANAASPPKQYILRRSGRCVSGTTMVKEFNVSNKFVPFRKLTLDGTNISEIIYVADSRGNRYYEVDSLTQNVVYKRVSNQSSDSADVPENLELLPCPYRYTVQKDVNTGTTSIRFGSGRADTLDDDIIPDPSELSLPLYGKKEIKRFSIDPNNLLRTQSLGISPMNTTVLIKYRMGGGLSHNVSAGSIRGVKTLITRFDANLSSAQQTRIRASIDCRNPQAAAGGENQVSLSDMKRLLVSAKNTQSRIVTKADLISHVYMMPSRFGRVYRVGVRSNPDNPLATLLYIVSRDSSGRLSTSPDSLKDNLALFLNENRLISDAIDILDSPVIHIGINYSIVVNDISNKSSVLQTINSKLKKYFKVSNFQIDQPIMTGDIQNIILNSAGVISLSEFEVVNLNGSRSGKVYSDVIFNIDDNTHKGIISPVAGGIFEMRYPDFDITAVAE
jgi:hypothetical protein